MLEMSHSKRPWDSTVTIPSEVAPIKRRAVSRLSNPSTLNDASGDDLSDQDMASVTAQSTSTALSEVHSALSESASSSSRSTPTPASAPSDSLSANTREQWPSRRGICFGMVRSNQCFVLIHD